MSLSNFFKKYEIILVFCLFFIIAGVHNFIHSPGIAGDTYSYLDSIQVVGGNVPAQDFVPIRILTTYLGLEFIVLLQMLFGDLFVAWSFANILFFSIGSTFFYLFTKDVFRNSISALSTTLLVALNYAIIFFGLTYLLDMPGWAFYMASLWAIFKYLNWGSKKYFWLTSLIIGLGFLFKEYVGLGYIAFVSVIIFRNWGEWKSLIQTLILSLASFIPLGLLHLFVYFNYGYTYLIRLLYEQSTFENAYSSRVVEFIKSFGSLYNLGWILFIIGVVILWKRWGLLKEFVNPNLRIFAIILAISLFPVFLWPGITQRVLGIAVPFFALVSGTTFYYFKNKPLWITLAIVFYAVINSSMPYLLGVFNLSDLFSLF
jgi:hypothetical protein